jgi:hypothetical protein
MFDCRRVRAQAARVGTLGATVVLAGCGTVRVSPPSPSALQANVECLKRHGIAHAGEVGARTPEETAIPGLLAYYGAAVPRGATRAQFERAVTQCGGGIHVGRVPVTSGVAKAFIAELRQCLGRNGYRLPAPDYPGPGPLLDTGSIDVRSSRWVATVKGCGATPRMDPAQLERCMGARTLQRPTSDPEFERRVDGLRECLKGA